MLLVSIIGLSGTPPKKTLEVVKSKMAAIMRQTKVQPKCADLTRNVWCVMKL